MIRVVYDTNVIVSGLLRSGRPSLLLELALQKKVSLFLSPSLLAEYEEVLDREKFIAIRREAGAAIRRLKAVAHLITPDFTLQLLPDPPDNRVLECAVAASADYLVTGNTRHFPFREFRGVKIVTPTEFLAALEPASG